MSLAEAFRQQSDACTALGSPFMGRLMTLFADRLTPGGAVADRVLNWPGDYRVQADSVPLRLAGALHALKLDGLALGAVYPPHQADDDTLWSEVSAAMADHEARILRWLDSAPQTNEVRRSAAILPALTTIAARFERPLSLIELGCSGGLNLFADRMALDLDGCTIGAADSPLRLTPDWTGPLPPAADLTVASRFGVDLNPIDANATDGRLKLLAYLWPDQPDRILRTETAIALAAHTPPRMFAGDAADGLSAGLDSAAAGSARVIFHTVAWQYFPDSTKARATARIEDAGRQASIEEPLAWVSMENDDGRGAALTLRLWPGDGTPVALGRADFHGRWIDWQGLPRTP